MLNPNTNNPITKTVTTPLEVFDHAVRCIWAAELILELEKDYYHNNEAIRIILDSLEANNPEKQMQELAKEVCLHGETESDTPADDGESNA